MLLIHTFTVVNKVFFILPIKMASFFILSSFPAFISLNLQTLPTLIVQYHLHSESTRNVKVHQVFTIHRNAEESNFRYDLHNRQLLFHSSAVKNFVGILSRWNFNNTHSIRQ